MSIKLIALDLDGTTLNSQGKLSGVTQKSLEKAIENGVHVVIATGRVRNALPEEIFKVSGIEYAITSNGAAITVLNEDELIYTNCIESYAIQDVYRVLSKYAYMVEVFIKGKAYVEKKLYENIEKAGLKSSHMEYVKKTRLPQEDIFSFMLKNSSLIENININFSDQKDKAAMKNALTALKGITVTSSFDHNLEIGGATTSKATALRALCKKLHIDVEEVMACGDSPNDEAMMAAAGLPIAMGNAKDSVKSIAKYVTGTNDEDGVAQAIQKFVLI